MKDTNSAFCLSNIILGLLMEHYFFCLQEWEYITNAKDFAYGLLNLFLFFCDKTLQVLLIQFFLHDAIACIWNFLLIKFSKILMLKQYLEQC